MLTNKEINSVFAKTMISLLLIIGGCQLVKAFESRANAPTVQIPNDRPMIKDFDAKR